MCKKFGLVNMLCVNFSNKIAIQNNYNLAFKGLKRPTFKNSPAEDVFQKSNVENYDWEIFVPKITSFMTDENFLGSGDEAIVYAINDKYVLRTSVFVKDGTKYIPVEDVFEGKNFGQAVAVEDLSEEKDYLQNIPLDLIGMSSINKRVYGKILHKHLDCDVDNYLKLLQKYSNLPDETLEEFISDVAFINSKGFYIDKSNPENFLYDENTGKIGIVDLGKKGDFLHGLLGPYSHEWILSPLVNGRQVIKFHKNMTEEQREKMYSLITKLENRILPICKKYGIPKADINFSHSITNELFEYLKMYRSGE